MTETMTPVLENEIKQCGTNQLQNLLKTAIKQQTAGG